MIIENWDFFAKISRKFNLISRKSVAFLRQIKAKTQGKSFYCSHLSDVDSYESMGVVINSDLTISCNSDDHYGNGKLGSLKSNTIKEVFLGKTSNAFRQKLAKGILPIPECSNCPSLIEVKKKEAKKYIYPDVDRINNIMLEQTVTCNIDCLSCNREFIYSNRTKKFINLREIEKISEQFKTLQIENLFYLNLGEPFVSNNIFNVLSTIKNNNPDIKIISSTNGMLVNTESKQKAALLFDILYVTLPGSNQKTVSIYQKGQNYEMTLENFVSLNKLKLDQNYAGGTIVWKYLIFNWNHNDENIKDAILTAKALNFDEIKFVVCISPFYGMSLKYLFFPPKFLSKISKQGFRNKYTLIKHREYDISLKYFDVNSLN